MGLFQKVKNILFDEEEDYTSQIKITPDMRAEDLDEKKEEPIKKVAPEVKKEEPIQHKFEEKEQTSERELFKADSTFPFFDEFDEKEFNNAKPKVEEKPVVVKEEKKIETRHGNVLQYESRKRTEKRTDYGRYERTEITETVDRRKFKPSPIISPVYGILNQDYRKEDIIKRDENDSLNIDSVRNKAFGEKKEEKVKAETPKEETRTTYYEDEETVSISIPEEKERKVKTIDELLEDTSDMVIDVDRDLKNDLDVDYDIKDEQSAEDDKRIENDTLENDLFDLIDSMYDKDEDGE